MFRLKEKGLKQWTNQTTDPRADAIPQSVKLQLAAQSLYFRVGIWLCLNIQGGAPPPVIT